MRRLNPLTGLRPRIAVLVLGGVLLLAALMMRVSAHSVDGAYERAARSELNAIATTWEDGFDVSDLADPQLMQQRVHAPAGAQPEPRQDRRLLARRPRAPRASRRPAGRRPATPRRSTSARRATATSRSAGGHHAEIHYPVGPGPDAMLELHYDLAALDRARASDGDDARAARPRRRARARRARQPPARPHRRAPARPRPRRRQPASARATAAPAPTCAAATRSASSRATST